MKKAQAKLVTSFFLIIVILVVIVGFAGFLEGMFIIDTSLKTHSMKYELAEDAKSFLIKRYGYPLPFDFPDAIEIPMSDSAITIRGLSFEQIDFPFCEHEILFESKPESYRDTIVYILPIAHEYKSCPGKLTVYI